MRAILYIIMLTCLLAGFIVGSSAKSAIHEITAILIFVPGVMCLCTCTLLEGLDKIKITIEDNQE